jgi:hypothetical protein|tara:strand:+ start:1518 stop:1730 length:213 start_codon:yes stop_codon:yes gene_type:complete
VLRDDSGISLGGPAEIERRELIAHSNTNEMLRKEVKTMQGQLQAAYIRISELTNEINELKTRKNDGKGNS